MKRLLNSTIIVIVIFWINIVYSNEVSQIPKGHLDLLKNGCISAAKKDGNLTKKTLNYCICYSNWIKNNLSVDEFNDFLELSHENKINFILKNKIKAECYKD